MKVLKKITGAILALSLMLTSIAFMSKTTKAEDMNDKLAILGYQYSVLNDGFRITYTIPTEFNNKEVKNRGLVYGAKMLGAKKADMIINSDSEYVINYNATNKGKITCNEAIKAGCSNIYGEDNDYYLMTMKTGHKTKFMLTGSFYARPYVVLDDNTVIYGQIKEFSIFNIAKCLYDNCKSTKKEYHDFLYDNILKLCDENYTKIDYEWSNAGSPEDIEIHSDDDEDTDLLCTRYAMSFEDAIKSVNDDAKFLKLSKERTNNTVCSVELANEECDRANIKVYQDLELLDKRIIVKRPVAVELNGHSFNILRSRDMAEDLPVLEIRTRMGLSNDSDKRATILIGKETDTTQPIVKVKDGTLGFTGSGNYNLGIAFMEISKYPQVNDSMLEFNNSDGYFYKNAIDSFGGEIKFTSTSHGHMLRFNECGLRNVGQELLNNDTEFSGRVVQDNSMINYDAPESNGINYLDISNCKLFSNQIKEEEPSDIPFIKYNNKIGALNFVNNDRVEMSKTLIDFNNCNADKVVFEGNNITALPCMSGELFKGASDELLNKINTSNNIIKEN